MEGIPKLKILMDVHCQLWCIWLVRRGLSIPTISRLEQWMHWYIFIRTYDSKMLSWLTNQSFHFWWFILQIRVSQNISNGQIILNVDCDMYSNYSSSVRDALCFFLDEKKGHEIAFVQFPQSFGNITKNEIYDGSMRIGMDVSWWLLIIIEPLHISFLFHYVKFNVILIHFLFIKVEFHGMDGYGGPPYVGTGCFHRRNTLTGKKFDNECMEDWKREETVDKIKALASCTYEENTQWGKEVSFFPWLFWSKYQTLDDTWNLCW